MKDRIVRDTNDDLSPVEFKSSLVIYVDQHSTSSHHVFSRTRLSNNFVQGEDPSLPSNDLPDKMRLSVFRRVSEAAFSIKS